MSNYRVGKWLARLIDEREKLGHRNIATERGMLRTHVEPHELGDLEVAMVTSAEARSWWRTMLGKALKPSTLRNVLSLVRVAFRQAVAEGLRETNPFRELAVPRVMRTTLVRHFADGALTWKEQHDLLVALNVLECEGRYAKSDVTMVRVALGTGLRRSELLSLHWCDVELEAEPGVVVRYGAHARPTKGGSPRVVPLFGDGLMALQAWRKSSLSDDLVFPGADGKPRTDVPRATLAAALHLADLRRIRWHDLRHSCATMLLEGERGRAWTLSEVQQLLGHSTQLMTERYVHATGSLVRRAGREEREAHDTDVSPPPKDERGPPLAHARVFPVAEMPPAELALNRKAARATEASPGVQQSAVDGFNSRWGRREQYLNEASAPPQGGAQMFPFGRQEAQGAREQVSDALRVAWDEVRSRDESLAWDSWVKTLLEEGLTYSNATEQADMLLAARRKRFSR